MIQHFISLSSIIKISFIANWGTVSGKFGGLSKIKFELADRWMILGKVIVLAHIQVFICASVSYWKGS